MGSNKVSEWQSRHDNNGEAPPLTQPDFLLYKFCISSAGLWKFFHPRVLRPEERRILHSQDNKCLSKKYIRIICFFIPYMHLEIISFFTKTKTYGLGSGLDSSKRKLFLVKLGFDF